MDFVAFHAPSDSAIQQWAAYINAVCRGTSVPPCLLAAIVKRETNGANIFQIGMPKGEGCGVGLGQITFGVCWDNPERPTFNGLDLTVPENNLRVAVQEFLVPLTAQAAAAQHDEPRAFAVSCRGQLAFAIAAGYNAGWGAVEAALLQGVDADTKTTNGYAADVFHTYLMYLTESHA